jgi:hypothetical protein
MDRRCGFRGVSLGRGMWLVQPRRDGRRHAGGVDSVLPVTVRADLAVRDDLAVRVTVVTGDGGVGPRDRVARERLHLAVDLTRAVADRAHL